MLEDMMSHPRPTPDILIVGAGPTGLTLAHELLTSRSNTRRE